MTRIYNNIDSHLYRDVDDENQKNMDIHSYRDVHDKNKKIIWIVIRTEMCMTKTKNNMDSNS